MSIPIVALGTSTWDLVDRIERLHGSVTVVRRCLELADLLACAHTGMARAALIAEGGENLTLSVVEQLAMGSIHIVVLSGHDHERLAALGATVIPAQASAEDVIGLIEAVVAGPDPVVGQHGLSRYDATGIGPKRTAPPVQTGQDEPQVLVKKAAPGHMGSERPVDEGEIVTDPLEERDFSSQKGHVVTVWGPMGAPGRTVTALNLAAELTIASESVLLVDADTYAASIAASLGMREESAGLAQACRLADQGRMDATALAKCVTRVQVAGAGLDVLTGITRHDRWPEIRSTALESVLDQAVKSYDVVVVDVSFGLESDEEIFMDVVSPRRNAAALSACAVADQVVAVGAADALGIPRLVKSLPDLEDVALSAQLSVVITKVRKTSVGRHPQEAVREAWQRYSPTCDVHSLLDWDPDACDDALLAGAVLAETAATSPLRRQYTDLARHVMHPNKTSTTTPAAHAAKPVSKLGKRVGGWLRR